MTTSTPEPTARCARHARRAEIARRLRASFMAVMPVWTGSVVQARLPNVKTVARRALTVPVRRIGRAG